MEMIKFVLLSALVISINLIVWLAVGVAFFQRFMLKKAVIHPTYNDLWTHYQEHEKKYKVVGCILVSLAIFILLAFLTLFLMIFSSKDSVNDNLVKLPVNISEKIQGAAQKNNQHNASQGNNQLHKDSSKTTTKPNTDDANAKKSTLQGNNSYFVPYMTDLQKKVKKNWKPPRSSSSKKTVALFTVAKDGSLINVVIAQSSGEESMDKAAIDAINSSAPFNPLPKEFKGDKVDIRFAFDYNLIGKSTNQQNTAQSAPIQSAEPKENMKEQSQENEQIILPVPTI